MAKFIMRDNLTDDQRDYLIQQIVFTPAPEVEWIQCENERMGLDKKNHVMVTFLCYCQCTLDQQLFDQLYKQIKE